MKINTSLRNTLFLLLSITSLFLAPALSLLLGIVFALTLGSAFSKYTHKLSSLLLKVAIVGLGLGMNLIESLQSSAEGILFTVGSVIMVMVLGVVIGRLMGINHKLGYLVASGTAICGGSAIAAVSPVIKAKTEETSIALVVIFTLNGIAMFIFPYIGQWLELSQSDFGMWSAIAIHDTSAVVGAAQAYGDQALMVATTVKLSRALWIIPLSIASAFLFRKENTDGAHKSIKIPWFILYFVLAMVLNTYLPLPELLSNGVKIASHSILSLTLFLIGSTLSLKSLRSVGISPIILGVILWVIISVVALVVILWS